MPEINWSLNDPNAFQKGYSYADQIAQQAAQRQAGQAYANGDYAGAASTLARSGDIVGAQKVQNYQQTQEDTQAARTKAAYQYLGQAIPVFQAVLKQHAGDPDGGKAAIGQAFDHIAPEMAQFPGSNSQAIAVIRQSLVNDPEGTLQRLQASLPAEFKTVAPGDTYGTLQGGQFTPQGSIAPRPTIPAGYTLGPDGQSMTAIPGGPADPNVVKTLADNKRGPEGNLSLDPNSLDYVAQQYAATGQLPPLGMGQAGVKMRQQIITRAAQMAQQAGTTGNDAVATHADTRAMTQSLGQVSKTRNMIESFEQTAQKNADLALSLVDKGGPRGQAPVINRWIQAGRKSIQGDPDVAAYDLALTTFKNEYARVVNSATGGGVTTDAARSEIERLLNTAQTAAQVKAVIATAKQDMANRRNSLLEQEDKLRARLSGNHTDTSEQAAPTIQFRYDAQGNRISQ